MPDVAPGPPHEPFADFVLERRYRLQRDIWQGAGPGFGAFIAGINPKGAWPHTEAVVVLAEVGQGPYADRWDGADLIYTGEDDAPKHGKNAHLHDQQLNKGRNRVLTHQAAKGIPTYLFWRKTGDPDYRYEGLVEVVTAELVPVPTASGSRLEAKYRLRLLREPSLKTVRPVEEEVRHLFRDDPLPPPQLVDPLPSVRLMHAQVRDGVFAREVKRLYQWTCAVCGEQRFDALGRPEVEAAHIFPKKFQGKDDPRNALSLCRFHHWAFDGHLFWLDDALVIHAINGGERVSGVAEFAGKALVRLPPQSFHRPHPIYLEARRRMAEGAGHART